MEQAAGQAAQTAAMSVRFLVTVAMAVAEHTGREHPARAAQVERLRQLNQPAGDPAERYAAMVRAEFKNPALRNALLDSEQWPQIAADLRYLESAGIDVSAFIRDAGAIADRIAGAMPQEPTPEQMVRAHMGDRLADTLVNSQRWPQIADEMRQMQAAGIDVPQMLRSAAEPGAKIEATLTAAWQTQAARVERLEKESEPVRGTARPESENRRGRSGKDGLTRREAALKEAGVSPQENQKYIRMMGEAVEDRHHAAVLAVSTRWPEIAATMKELDGRKLDPAARLARLPQELARQAGNRQRVNLVDAAAEALRHPAPATSAPAGTRPAPAETYAAKPASSVADTTLKETIRDSDVVVAKDQLRAAAHHVVGARNGVNTQTLRDGLGVDERQATALMSELSKRDVIGHHDPKTDRYQVQVKGTMAADLLVDGKEVTAAHANKTAAWHIAQATSKNSDAPQAKNEPAAPAPRTAPAQTQTKGRTR